MMVNDLYDAIQWTAIFFLSRYRILGTGSGFDQSLLSLAADCERSTTVSKSWWLMFDRAFRGPCDHSGKIVHS
jgi:hypothetical protein